MKFVSTRSISREEKVSAAYAIKQGLASDGGLYMPLSIPKIDSTDIEKFCKMTYPERAAKVLSIFLEDYTYEELLADCTAAYCEASFPGGAAPVASVADGMKVLELWHGPTCAFKDMALQIMPRLLSRALEKTGEERTAFILVATSGDTGKAALEGYRDIPRTGIMVFYPVDGVSKIQKMQMATQEGKNVSVCAIKGNFDDAQTGVKKIFSDKEMASKLDKNGYFLSSANSINWGRLAPQIVYYISAYCDLVSSGDIKNGESINITVPTGNFGNIFAAFIAREMGLPVNRLICASNKNNILSDFIATGKYDRNRKFFTTMSPSMDILISSNLERLLYVIGGAEKTVGYMKDLSEKGVYTVDGDVKAKIDEVFTGLYCDEEETSKVIKKYFDEYGYLCDTHTAVALKCAAEYIANTGDGRKMLVASTASPYKFATSVYDALTGKATDDDFKNIDLLSNHTSTEIPAPIAGVLTKKVRFEKTIEAADMPLEVLSSLGI